MRCLLSSLLLALALASCKSEETLGCSSTCPSGNACIEGKCEQVCEDDGDCAAGARCERDICVVSAGGRPVIATVSGDGSTSCPDAVSGTCFTDRVIVSGQALLGSEFRLEGAATYTLAVAPDSTAIRATLLLPGDLLPGEYTLVAQNAAGSDDTGVLILQGEPGPDSTGTELVARLNGSGTTGRFVVERMPVADVLIQHLNAASGAYKLKAEILNATASSGGPSTGNAVVDLINGSGTSTVIAANRVEPPSGSSLVSLINLGSGTISAARVSPPAGSTLMAQINTEVSGTISASRVEPPSGLTLLDRINAAASGTIDEARLPTRRLYKQDTTADANALDVTFAELLPLCGDADGCTLQLGYRFYDIDGIDSGASNYYPDVPSTLWGPSCRMHLDEATGFWSIAQWCVQGYWTDSGNGTGRWNYIYASANADRDGDGDPVSLLVYYTNGGFGCFLSEVRPTIGTDLLQNTDVADQKFYFWMNSQATPGYFDSPSRSCELLVED
jgi:hypothetical protein